MAGMDFTTLAIAKSYTDISIEGAGAIKGKACQIQSITDITGGHRVTFAWYDDDDVLSTSTLDVMDGTQGEQGETGAPGQDGADGADGVGISSIDFKEVDQDGNNVYTITLTDTSTYDFTSPKGATGATGADGQDGIGVPPGGATGQILKKASGTDYDTVWGNESGGGSINYSTDEQVVGTWIDGSSLYQKTVDCGALPNNTTKEVAHGITDIGSVVDAKGFAIRNTDYTNIFFPDKNIVDLYVKGDKIYLTTNNDKRTYTVSYVTLQYTKVSI